MSALKIISKTERDGVGFAQSGAAGLHARYVTPTDHRGIDALPELRKRAGKAAAAFALTETSDQSGNYKPTRSLIIHGRTATHGAGLPNTHPFRHAGWTLAHNGVVNWLGQKSKLHSAATCDSQHLLYCLTENGTELTRKKALENVRGYAAFLALAPNGDLIAAVDDIATLHAGITAKGRWIFGTTAEIVRGIAASWKCAKVEPFKLKAWSWLHFTARRPAADPVLSTWQHAAAAQREYAYSSRSLGRTVSRFPDYTPSNSVGAPFGSKHDDVDADWYKS